MFGNYVAVYKFDRTLHYLSSTTSTNSNSKIEEESKIFSNYLKFFRSFYSPLPIKAAFIVSSPLISVVIVDNANIKTYSINGQFIKGIFSNAANLKKYGRFKDNELHDVFYTAEEDRIICYSMPDLRSISVLELPEEYEFVGDSYLTVGSSRN